MTGFQVNTGELVAAAERLRRIAGDLRGDLAGLQPPGPGALAAESALAAEAALAATVALWRAAIEARAAAADELGGAYEAAAIAYARVDRAW